MGDIIRTRHEVIFARWYESSGNWRVKVKSDTGEFEDNVHYLVDA